MDKNNYFRVVSEGTKIVCDSLEQVQSCLENWFDGIDAGSEYKFTVETVMMTPEEFDNLKEFQGY